MKIIRLFVGITVVIFFFPVYAQKPVRWEAGFPLSYSWAHHNYMNHLTGRICPAVQVAFSGIPDPVKHAWVSRYNFPETGISLIVQDLGYAELGRIYALLFHYTFFLNRRDANWLWSLRFGNGAGWNTRPYDKVSNPKNIIFGSHVLYAFQLSLRVRYRFDGVPLSIEGGPGLFHYSNGGTKPPNSGLNLPGIQIALIYGKGMFDGRGKRFVRHDTLKKNVYPGYWNFFARLGFNEADVPGIGLRPSYTLGFSREWHPSYKNIYFAGVEVMFTRSLQAYLEYLDIAYNAYGGHPPDYKRIALLGGYRMYMDKTVMGAGVGMYVYNPSGKEAPFYIRLSFQRQLTPHWHVSVSLKTHYFFAEIIDMGLHYHFFKAKK